MGAAMTEHPPLPRSSKVRRTLVNCLAVVVFGLVAGTAWHEIVGHGLTAVAFGARITYIEVLGLQWYPSLKLADRPSHLGQCGHTEINDPTSNAVIRLAGSLSTWFVGVFALALLYAKRWCGWSRLLVIALSIWWADLLANTLASFGISRYVPWPAYSEPYEAARALGMPGPVFQALVVVSSSALAVVFIRRAWAPSTWRERNQA
jgi:hypothetical protein